MVAVAAITGIATWLVPIMAACFLESPPCWRRKLFSVITMAWSTIRPRTRTIPNRVLVLKVCPDASRTIKTMAKVTGIPRAVINAFRSPTNAKSIAISKSRPIRAFLTRTSILDCIGMEESLRYVMLMSSGIFQSESFITDLTPSITRTELPLGTFLTRRVTAVTPLSLDLGPFGSYSSETSATSLTRTVPPSCLIITSPNATA